MKEQVIKAYEEAKDKPFEFVLEKRPTNMDTIKLEGIKNIVKCGFIFIQVNSYFNIKTLIKDSLKNTPTYRGGVNTF